jgi:hypothetical protein
MHSAMVTGAKGNAGDVGAAVPHPVSRTTAMIMIQRMDFMVELFGSGMT